ncbi:MAG: glycoside hydrolase [Saccharofermentans sp.]|nr:glycoside hydrolase [Saccharofermentans sp.]
MNKKFFTSVLLISAFVVSFVGCSKSPQETEHTTIAQSLAEVTATTGATETTMPLAPIIVATPTPYPYVDNVAPFFLKITRNPSITVGDEFSIDDYISYIDNTDPDVTLIVDGTVDNSLVGSYPLSLRIEDENGNYTTDSITVSVVAPVEPGSGGGSYSYDTTPFSDFIASYPGDDIHYGIDVSVWQGDIDFNTVRDSGCEFVFIRAGRSSNGEFTEDDYFRSNIANATEAGLHVGVYVYSSDNSIEAVEALADRMIEMTEGYNVDLPIVFDWEAFGRFQQFHMSIIDLNNLYAAFENRLEAQGRSGMLYSSKYYLDVVWNEEGSNVWLAHYNSQTDYTGEYIVWQQSCTGRIPGINADVDMDLWYGDFPG